MQKDALILNKKVEFHKGHCNIRADGLHIPWQ
jgi:hypothetical protein